MFPGTLETSKNSMFAGWVTAQAKSLKFQIYIWLKSANLVQ